MGKAQRAAGHIGESMKIEDAVEWLQVEVVWAWRFGTTGDGRFVRTTLLP